jgi:ADP-heptose:LPS heptosyltransferase
MPQKRIIIFKPGPIGDFLHSLPVARALKETFPDATITMITGPGLADIAEGNPFIDELIYVPTNLFKGDLPGFFAFLRKVRALEADLFVDLKSNVKSVIIGAFSGAGKRFRYKKQRGAREGERRLHAIENLFATISPVAGEMPADSFRIYLRREDEEFVDRFMATLSSGMTSPREGENHLVALNANVSIPNSSRHWPPEYFARLGDRLKKELAAHIILIGGAEDRDYCEGVAKMMETRPVITAGELTLGQTGALLSRCRVLVSGDTGPMHLAAAVGTRVDRPFRVDGRKKGRAVWKRPPSPEKRPPLRPLRGKDLPTSNHAVHEGHKRG